MRTPRLIFSALTVATLLAGCSTAASNSATNTSGYTGAAGKVATTVNIFATNANAADATAICTNVLSSALVKRLNRVGGCHTVITNQLNTISDFSLKIGKKAIRVSGSTAQVRVKSLYNGKNVLTTLKLVHEHAGWRVDSIG